MKLPRVVWLTITGVFFSECSYYAVMYIHSRNGLPQLIWKILVFLGIAYYSFFENFPNVDRSNKSYGQLRLIVLLSICYALFFCYYYLASTNTTASEKVVLIVSLFPLIIATGLLVRSLKSAE